MLVCSVEWHQSYLRESRILVQLAAMTTFLHRRLTTTIIITTLLVEVIIELHLFGGVLFLVCHKIVAP